MSAVLQQDAVVAMDAYELARRLPVASTTFFFESLGIQVSEQVFPNNPNLSTCLKNGEPRMLKVITKEKHERQAVALAADVQFLPSHHLVPFRSARK